MTLDPSDCLCPATRDPSLAADPVRIECRVETGSYAPAGAAPGASLKVAAWNLERGMHFERQRDLLLADPDLAGADVVLLSEADRGCCRTGGRNVARELAEALAMDFAFAVQYVELPRPPSRKPTNHVPRACEHGNAILSRYPLLEPTQLRHTRTVDWFGHPKEPRLGGIVSLRAGIAWGEATLRLYAVHFDSGLWNDALRAAQAREVVADAADHTGPVLIGGDMNTYRYKVDVHLGTRIDPTPRALVAGGFADAHAGLPARRRGTTDRSYGVRGVIDLVWTRGLAVSGAGVVPPRRAAGLSDHFPVWAEIAKVGPALPY